MEILAIYGLEILYEYELNYSTYLWIFKGKSSRNYEGRNRGVTIFLIAFSTPGELSNDTSLNSLR